MNKKRASTDLSKKNLTVVHINRREFDTSLEF